MKNLLAKFKGQDYKQLALEHGEKAALGAVALFALLALAFGTQWGRFDKDPQVLKSTAATVQQTVAAADWAPAERQTHETPPKALEVRVAQTFGDVDPGRLAWLSPFVRTYEPKDGVVESPRWFPLSNPVADASRHVLLVEEFAAAAPADGAQPVPGGVRPAAPAGAAAPGFNPLAPAPLAGIPAAGAGGQVPGGPVPAELPVGLPVPEPRRVVGLRAVFNLRGQLEEIARALNLPATNVDPSLLKIHDFEILRQTAVPGPNPWSGPWEPVDIEVAYRMLDRAISIEEERVNPGITHRVSTMPMPVLLFGDWASLATHPDVVRFHQTKEGAALQEKFDARVRELLAEHEQEQQVTEGGFAKHIWDRRAARDALQGTLPQAVMDKLSREFTPEQLAELRVSATGNLLLFRYLDFDVAPGETYRYKVRLQVRNPNFGKLPAELKNPEDATREFDFTPWSKETEPVVVPEDAEYFVRQIAPPSRLGQPAATFHVYQWYAKVGTQVVAELKAEYGAIIGGETKTNVAYPPDPASREPFGVLKEESVKFLTKDVLVDIADVPALDASLHADLGRGVRPIDHALIADAEGRIVPLDPVSREEDYEQAAKRLEKEWLIDLEVRAPTADQDALDREAEKYRQDADSAANNRDRARRLGLTDNPNRIRTPRNRR